MTEPEICRAAISSNEEFADAGFSPATFADQPVTNV
jgi:hypothetical protein